MSALRPAPAFRRARRSGSSTARSWSAALSPLLLLCFCAVAMAADAGQAPAATAPAAQDATPLLKSMIQACRDLKTYQQHATTTREMSAPGALTRVWTTGTTFYQAPNLYARRDEPGVESATVVADGHNLYMWTQSAEKVAKAPGLADLRDAKAGKALQPPGESQMMQPGTAMPDFLGCLTGTFSLDLVKAATVGLPSGSQWLRSMDQLEGCTAVTITPKKGPKLAVWIDKESHLPRQVAVEMSMSDLMKAMLGAMGGDEADASAGMPESMRDMTIREWTTVSGFAVNRPIPASSFVFEAPKGAKVVEVKDAAEIAQALAPTPEGMAGAGQGAENGSSEEAPPQSKLAGKAPIDFTAQSLDGKPVKLSSFRGKPVVLDFWATWCPPCRAELPILDALCAKYKSQGLQIVAVCGDEKAAIDKFLKANPLGFTVLWMDPKSPEAEKVFKEYDVTAIPRTLYISSDWVVKTDTVGLHAKADIIKALGSIGIKTE